MTIRYQGRDDHQEVMPNPQQPSRPGGGAHPANQPRRRPAPTSTRHRSSRRHLMRSATAQLALWLGMFAAAGTLGTWLGNQLRRHARR